MNLLHPERKRRLRREILRILAVHHAQQQSRMDDVALTHALFMNGWHDIEINDVVTLLQEMQRREWVDFQMTRNVYARRAMLSKIEILPGGVDIVEQTTTDPAVEF